jgi:hypothetical protein
MVSRRFVKEDGLNPIAWNRELIDQLDFAWEHQFLPRLAGLTDTEYLWEPVPDCWTIRPGEDGRWRWEIAWPSPEPPPFTTIAWRMMHLVQVFGERDSNHFGDGTFRLREIAVPETAAGGIALLTENKESWTGHLRDLGDEGLSRPCGPAEGPFATLILHINREFLHHAAEIQLLRDLYLRQG